MKPFVMFFSRLKELAALASREQLPCSKKLNFRRSVLGVEEIIGSQ